MTTPIGSPRTGHNLRCALFLHAHHRTALGPGIGTAFQLESRYASRNNRNSFSYEKTFFSYDHVPTLRYDSNIPNPGRTPFSSLGLSRLATDHPRNSLTALPDSEQSPKLSQSCDRNSHNPASPPPFLNLSRSDTSPAASSGILPYKPEHGPKLFQSYGRNNSRPGEAGNHAGRALRNCRRSRPPCRHPRTVDNPRPGPLTDSPALRITETREVLCGPLFGGYLPF